MNTEPESTKSLPTVEELEKLMERDDLEIEILPDGSIHAVKKGTKQDSVVVPITSKYAAAEFY